MHQPSPHDDTATDTHNPTRQPSTLAQLRALSPNRPLADEEIPDIAEAQANLLLKLNNITRPPVPTASIAELPRIEVVQDPKMPNIAGATVWHGSRWLIVINGRDRLTRRRITLAMSSNTSSTTLSATRSTPDPTATTPTTLTSGPNTLPSTSLASCSCPSL